MFDHDSLANTAPVRLVQTGSWISVSIGTSACMKCLLSPIPSDCLVPSYKPFCVNKACVDAEGRGFYSPFVWESVVGASRLSTNSAEILFEQFFCLFSSFARRFTPCHEIFLSTDILPHLLVLHFVWSFLISGSVTLWNVTP